MINVFFMENLYLCTKLKIFYNLCQIKIDKHDRGQSLVILTFKIYKQWTSVNINNIINFAKNQGLDIKVEESDGQGE